MTTSHDLTTKKKIVDVIQRMPEDATIDDAINRLRLLKAVAERYRLVPEIDNANVVRFKTNRRRGVRW